MIRRFTVPSNEASGSSLLEIDMPRLGQFVAIAGRNGSGKSRLLDMLEALLVERNSALPNVHGYESALQNTRTALEAQPDSPHVSEWRRSIVTIERALDVIYRRAQLDDLKPIKPLRFVPKNLLLEDTMTLAPSLLLERYASAPTVDVTDFAAAGPAHIQQTQNRWWNVTHQKFAGPQEEKTAVIEEYDRLKDLVKLLLDAELTRSTNDEASLFGKPIAKAKLSDGQRVLLQLAAAIHSQKSHLTEIVFILDEIENHLHPSAVIDILESIRVAAPAAQVWIATHSVPLLAYITSLEPMAVWFMEGGAIGNAGRHPERVLESLLGDEEQIGRLNSFTGLPALLASVNYAAESLLPPTTVSISKDDPQLNQINRLLREKISKNPLCILDFGAGQGRLLDGLAALCQGELKEHISYFAYDTSEQDIELCNRVIAEHFGTSNRYFNSAERFFSHKEGCSIDVVVMCNVLHEVAPAKWISILSQGLIPRCLSNDGYLMIVEDLRIPIGELAHDQGFIVFDTAHLRTLFAVTDADVSEGRFFTDDQRGDGRLKAHLIAKSLLGRISATTRDSAIAELAETAKEKISELRSAGPSYTNGLSHGFWTQQFANCHLYLSDQGLS